MALEAILFDLDGTIFDTEVADFNAWAEVYKRYNIPLLKEMWSQRVGYVNYGGFDPRRHLESLGIILTEEEASACYDKYIANCKSQPVLPGVKEMIESAQKAGLKLAVASNSDSGWVHRWLDFLDLKRVMQCVLTRDDVTNPKPAPEIYLTAAACVGVSPENCIVIEDSPVGMKAALSAGIRCIGVPSWLTVDLPKPEGVVLLESLAQVTLDDLQMQLA